MEITDKLTRQLTEAKYLAVENTKRYRPILRFCYMQYERTKYMLYKEEIYNALKGENYFEDYTIDMCEQDLKYLVECANLIAIQDTSTVMTIEEFKNKKYRYQLSDFSVEIERLVIKLENLYIEGSSLESTLVERIKDEILKIDQVLEKRIDVSGWWKSLNSDFKLLNENYKDYIRDFYTTNLEEFVKTEEFVKQKDALVRYLRNFISALQKNSYVIEEKLKKLSKDDEMIMLNNILESQKQIVRVDTNQLKITDDEYFQNNFEKWKNLKFWFISIPQNPESEIHRIYEITNEIIQKITRYAAQIMDSKGNVSVRKEEYKKVCELFATSLNIEDANKLSSLVFGIFRSKHIKGNFDRKSDSININIGEEEAEMIEIKPRTRNFRERSVKVAIVDKSEEKERMKLDYNERIQKEQDIFNSYIIDNKIVIENLDEVERNVRKTLLKWISKSYSVVDGTIKTENGRKVRILPPQDLHKCILKSTDGNLVLPAYIIEFLD